MKIAWAYNPFDDNRKLQNKALMLIKSLRPLSKRTEFVYVASPMETGLAHAFDVPERQRLTSYPKELIRSAIGKMGLAGSKVTVITQDELSLTSMIKGLTKYLSKEGMDLTLVASHARTGVSRFFMGSFAETLVHYSKSNLVLFNERTIIRPKPKTLLFAHDLSSEAEVGLIQAIDYARALKATLHVVYVPIPVYHYNSQRYATEMSEYRKLIQKDVQKIQEKLDSAKVEGTVVISTHLKSTAELILMRMKSVRADMIFVVAKTGRIMTLLGGSVTRKVIRSAPVPIIVIKC